MKKILLTLFILLLSLNANAQLPSMLSDNAEWYYSEVYKDNAGGELTHKIHGTFEADGKTYYTLYRVFSGLSFEGWYQHFTYPIGLREENGKVYAHFSTFEKAVEKLRVMDFFKTDVLPYQLTEEGELLLYDFTLRVGDRYPTSAGFGTVIVNRVDTIMISDGTGRKLLTLSNGFRILEGVGCIDTDELVFYLYDHHTLVEEAEDWYVALYQYRVNGSVVYEIGDDPSFRSTAIIDCIAPMEKLSVNKGIFDLQGRRLGVKPRKGAYIENGRKKVVK